MHYYMANYRGVKLYEAANNSGNDLTALLGTLRYETRRVLERGG